MDDGSVLWMFMEHQWVGLVEVDGCFLENRWSTMVSDGQYMHGSPLTLGLSWTRRRQQILHAPKVPDDFKARQGPLSLAPGLSKREMP